jgi:PAS domain S-box-containing protein
MSPQVVEGRGSEQLYHERESKYRFLFDHMMDGFAYHQVVFDDQGRPVDYVYLEVNDAFEKMTGLKKEDVVGKRVTELIPGVENEQAGWIEKYGRVALTGKPIKFEDYSEGLRRWYSVSAYSLGTPYFAAVFEDITASKQAEAEASEQQIRLGMALEAAEMVTWEWDIPTRSIRYADNIQNIVRGAAVEPYCSLDGLMPQIHPEDREGLAQALDQTSKLGTPFECEYRVHMLDGAYRWILGKGKRVVVEDGKPVRVLGLSMDITESKQKEETLRQSEAKFRILADDTYDMEFWIDPDGRYVFASPSSKRATGYDPQEFIENPQLRRNIVYPEDLPLFDRHLHEEKNSIPQEIDFRIIHADGSVRWTSHGCRRIFDEEGHFLGIRGSNRDITERKRAEEERERLLRAIREEKNRLSALINSIQDEVWFADAEKIFTLANPPALHEFGLNGTVGVDVGELAKSLEVFRPDGTPRPVEEAPPLRALQGEVVANQEEIIRTPVTGELRHRLVSAAPVKDTGGNIVGSVSVVRDITEQKRAEAVLRETEARRKVAEAVEAERERLYDVLETLPAYVVLLTPDYHAAFANRTFRERFGESHGRRCFEFLFGRSEPCETCETYTALKTMAPHEWEWAGPDGRIYFVHDFPFTDVDGSTLILEMGIDITQRKKAEQALRETSLYTRNLIEASLDPLMTISADGKIMDVNSATEVSTGVPRDELVGTDFSDYFTDPEKAREGYQEAFREGFVRDYPLAIRHKSGRVTDVLYNATVYRNEAGAVQGVFAAARDVTERKQAEEELRRKENQIRFFASQCLTAQETERRRVAAELHDSIAASLAGVKFKIEKIAQDMKQGLASVEAMQDLTSNVAQSLGEVRRIMVDLRPSILDDLGIMPALNWYCREYQKTYSHISVEKQIGIEELEVPDSLKTPIFRISQEAMNNIAKHSRASLVNLALQKEGEKIVLTIQDNGQGFDPGTVKKGMGLSSIRERAEFSGGSAELQSGIGKGTTIRVSWPG